MAEQVSTQHLGRLIVQLHLLELVHIAKDTRRKAGQRWRFLPGLTARTSNRMLLIFGDMDKAFRQIPNMRPNHRRNVGQGYRKGGVYRIARAMTSSI
jgi:hypothetical protein